MGVLADALGEAVKLSRLVAALGFDAVARWCLPDDAIGEQWLTWADRADVWCAGAGCDALVREMTDPHG